MRTLYFILFYLTILSTGKTQSSYSFVQLCDPQLGKGGYEHSVKSFTLAVTQINELNPDFVIICGDFVNRYEDSLFFKFLEINAKLLMPSYLLPGNHDVLNIPTDATLQYYRSNIAEDYYAFSHKGYRFICTNTQLWKVSVENESDSLNSWFKSVLSNNPDRLPVFVAGHYPLFTDSIDEKEHYSNLSLVKRQELLTLFQQNNVVAYLSGHAHRRIIDSYENILFVSGESTSQNKDNSPLGFRLWHVSQDSITQSFIPLLLPNN